MINRCVNCVSPVNSIPGTPQEVPGPLATESASVQALAVPVSASTAPVNMRRADTRRLVLTFWLLVVTSATSLANSLLEQAETLAYWDVFTASIIGSASIFFPIPMMGMVTAAGAFLNPIVVATNTWPGGWSITALWCSFSSVQSAK